MAIQMRRGEKQDFQPEKLKVGEFAVPTDTGEVYIKTSENVTKGIATLNSAGKLEQMPTYSDVGAAASQHKHSASDITSGTLPISKGGTGSTSASGAVSNLGAVPNTRTINSKALSSDITLDASDVGAVPSTRTINSKALSSDITLDYSDVGAVPNTRTVNDKQLNEDIMLDYSDVGAAASSHSHSASNITSGTLPISRGGTGSTSASGARSSLGISGASLYNNTSGTSGTITLSSSAANYNYLVIYYINFDSLYCSTKIYSPNGKKAVLNATTPNSSAGWFYRGCRATISGTAITLSDQTQAWISTEGGVNWNASITSIKITRVEGWNI